MVSSSTQNIRHSGEDQKNAPRSEPRPKASRYRNSCDACQAAKIKCGQQKPECHRCTAQEIQCVYSLSRRMGRPRQPTRAANQSSPSQRTQQEASGGQTTSSISAVGLDVKMSEDGNNPFAPGKKNHTSPQTPISTALEHDPRLMPLSMDLFQPTGIPFMDDFDFTAHPNDLGFPDLGHSDFSDLIKNPSFFAGPMDQHQLPSPEMSLANVNIGTPTNGAQTPHGTSSHAEDTLMANDGSLMLQQDSEAAFGDQWQRINQTTPRSVPTTPTSGINPSSFDIASGGSSRTGLPDRSRRCECYKLLFDRLCVIDEHQRTGLPLLPDVVLKLERDLRTQTSEVLACRSCIDNQSAILLLCMNIDKIINMLEKSANGKSRVNRRHSTIPRNNSSRSMAGGKKESTGSFMDLCQLRVGRFEVDDDQRATFLKSVLRARFGRLSDVLQHLHRVSMRSLDSCTMKAGAVMITDLHRRLHSVMGQVELWS